MDFLLPNLLLTLLLLPDGGRLAGRFTGLKALPSRLHIFAYSSFALSHSAYDTKLQLDMRRNISVYIYTQYMC